MDSIKAIPSQKSMNTKEKTEDFVSTVKSRRFSQFTACPIPQGADYLKRPLSPITEDDIHARQKILKPEKLCSAEFSLPRIERSKQDESPEIIPENKTSRLVRSGPVFLLEKVDKPHATKHYLKSNLRHIFTADNVLNGPYKLFLKTASNIENEFHHTALHVFYQHEEYKKKLSTIDGHGGHLIIYLPPTDENKMTFEFFINKERVFTFSFRFGFSDDAELLTDILMMRSVNVSYRRKGWCTAMSLNILHQIYKHLGTEKTMLTCSAINIGTVKFHYPLNKYYSAITNAHLRDVDPSFCDVDFHEIVKREENLKDFGFDHSVHETRANCIHDQIQLRKLLMQYDLRMWLDVKEEEGEGEPRMADQ